MIVNHNVPAIQAYNALTVTNNALQKSIQKLSTGLRINSAADDAAGLAISEKMRAQIRGLDRASSNAQDGISMIQTAEGALSETHSILQRMRELSVQAANDTLTQEDRQYIQLEMDELKEEISRIANTTQFNKKKLLDGSAAVLWSSDNLATKALVNGGLRQTDQFGQKAAVEGNFRISINATPGQTEIQKSDIFKIKHANVIMNLSIKMSSGIDSIAVDNLPAGDYAVTKTNVTATNNATAITRYGATGFTIDSADFGTTVRNTNILLEVTDVNASAGTVTFRAQSNTLSSTGEVESFTDDSLTLAVGATGLALGYDKLGFVTSATGAMTLGAAVTAANLADNYKVGDKIVIDLNSTETTDAPDAGIRISATINPDWQNAWTPPAPIANTYNVNAAAMEGKEVQFKNFYLNTENGTVYDGSVNITFKVNGAGDFSSASNELLASFEAAYVGQVAEGDVQLRDLDKFWDANGKFLLDDHKELTIYQGNGNKTSITLYATDTLNDVRSKLNDAIANGLGQAQYLKEAANVAPNTSPEFVSFVDESNREDNTPMSVFGTLVIRSVVPGAAGRLNFSGDEDLIKALSLNVIQNATESTYNVSVTDAHNPAKSVASNVKITGNVLYGIVNPNVDVEFDAMADTEVTWNGTKFVLRSINDDTYETILHLSDNTTVFQIGANEGEDMGVNIGDMSAHALGVDNILVTDRESAARSITLIDNAISRVSTQRAKLGAYQNRLEHTINNLTTASTNTTAAESRIRDADMAKEMMEFTKLNILSQAGNSMLAQANQLPQNVLALLR